MSEDPTRHRRSKPSTFGGFDLRGKWFRRDAGLPEAEDTDVIKRRRTRFNTAEKLAVAPWYKRAWAWTMEKLGCD